MMENREVVLLPQQEAQARLDKIKAAMVQGAIDCALISSNANIYYVTGRVFSGYVFISLDSDTPVYLIKRPVHLSGDNAVMIRKPEDILKVLADRGVAVSGRLGLELSRIPYTTALRLQAAMGAGEIYDINPALASARAVKTDYEVEMIRRSGIRHERVYRQIPTLYQSGMSDIELQVEIERVSRLDGCIGQFRIAGEDMEIYMGNILAGDNADNPSPYDFAMGGGGIDPSLPVGADGTIIKPGMSVMVDMNGNFTGYMTDMTRCFYLRHISPLAQKAHRLSMDICAAIAQAGVPGTEAKALYNMALDMAKAEGLEAHFMGCRQHAGFVGHGIGIEVNELPVLAPRSKQVLQAGNIIAVEPKFVIPGTGAVGVENTYLVRESGPMECLTNAPEQLIDFE